MPAADGDQPRPRCCITDIVLRRSACQPCAVPKWAALASLDHGRRIVGRGFVIAVALSKDRALATQNVLPCGVHLFGVYRYLVRKAAP